MVISDSGQEHVLILVSYLIRSDKNQAGEARNYPGKPVVSESSNKHGSKAKLGLQRSGDDGSNGWG